MEPDEIGNEVIDADELDIRLPHVRRPLLSCSTQAPELQKECDTKPKIRLNFMPMKSDRGRGRPARMPRPSDFQFVQVREALPFLINARKPSSPSSLLTNHDVRPIRKGRGASLFSKSMSSAGSSASSARSDSGFVGIDRLDSKEPSRLVQFQDAHDAQAGSVESKRFPRLAESMRNLNHCQTDFANISKSSEDVFECSSMVSDVHKSAALKFDATVMEVDPRADPAGNLPTSSSKDFSQDFHLVQEAAVQHPQASSSNDFSQSFHPVQEAAVPHAAECTSPFLMSTKYSPLCSTNDDHPTYMPSSSESDNSLFVASTNKFLTENPQFVVVKSPCHVPSERMSIRGTAASMCLSDSSRRAVSPLSSGVPSTINHASSNTDVQFADANPKEQVELPLFYESQLEIKEDIRPLTMSTTTIKCDKPNVPLSPATTVVHSKPLVELIDFDQELDEIIPDMNLASNVTSLQSPDETVVTVPESSNYDLLCLVVPSKAENEDATSTQAVQLKPAKATEDPDPFEALADSLKDEMKETSLPPKNLRGTKENVGDRSATAKTAKTVPAPASNSLPKVMTKKLTLKNLTGSSSEKAEDSKHANVQPKTWSNPELPNPVMLEARDKSIPPSKHPEPESTKQSKKEVVTKDRKSSERDITKESKSGEKGVTKDPKSGDQAKQVKNKANAASNSGKVVKDVVQSDPGHKSKLPKNELPKVDRESVSVPTASATAIQASRSALTVMRAELKLKQMTSTTTTTTMTSADDTKECKASHAKPKTWEEAQLLNPPKFDKYGLPIRQPVQRFCLAHDFPSLPAGNASDELPQPQTQPSSTATAALKTKKSKNKQQKDQAKVCNQQPDKASNAPKKDVHPKQARQHVQQQQQQKHEDSNRSIIVIENLPMDTNRGFMLDFLQQFDRNVRVEIFDMATSKMAEVRLSDDGICDWIVSVLNDSSISGNSDKLTVWKK